MISKLPSDIVGISIHGRISDVFPRIHRIKGGRAAGCGSF